MDTSDQRLSRVERRIRNQGALLTGLACVAATCLAGGAGQPESIPTTVRAQRFEVVTATGQRVAEIAFNSDLECGELTITSADGTKRVRLTGEKAQRNGAVEIYGESGVALGGLYADDNTGSGALVIRNAAGSQIHYTSGDKDGNAQSLSLNAAGRPIQKLSCTSKGAGWMSVRGADGTPLVQLGGANEDGNGVLLVGRTNNKPAAQLKGYSGFGVLSLFDDAGRVRVRVAATDEHGGRVGVVTPAGKTWSWWPATPESAASTTDHVSDFMDEILNGLK